MPSIMLGPGDVKKGRFATPLMAGNLDRGQELPV